MNKKNISSRVQVRPLEINDLEAIVELETKVHPFAWSRQAHLDSIQQKYPSLALCADNELIGFIVFNYLADECHLLDIAIAEDYLRQGLAQLLMEKMEQYALTAGMNRVILEVRQSNIQAQNLYQKLTYQLIGRRKNYYRGNLEQSKGCEDAIVLEKAL